MAKITATVIRPNNSILQTMLGKTLYPQVEGFRDVKYIYHGYEDDVYVSDLVGKEWKYQWVPSVPVIITVQTGKGKNTFIRDTLVPSVLRYNRTQNEGEKVKILLISNRIALNVQSKGNLVNVIDMHTSRHDAKYSAVFNDLGFEGQNKMSDFGQVTICSYQQLLHKNKILNEQFAFVILDEFHFFTQDASFNANTDKILERIVSAQQNAVRVYMSATPEETISLVLQMEEKYREPRKISVDRPFGYYTCELQEVFKPSVLYPEYGFPIFSSYEHPGYSYQHDGQEIRPFWEYNAIIYDMERNYDYVEVHSIKFSSPQASKEYEDSAQVSNPPYKSEYSNLIKEIEAHTEKWIIFIQDKDDAEKLAKYFNDTVPKDNQQGNHAKLAAFICAESKQPGQRGDHTTYKHIVCNEKFDERILFATSVLDNGINICDSSVKNVAIFSLDSVSFLQMLGRIRRKKDIKIRLYVPEYQVGQIEQMLRRNFSNLLFRLDFDKMSPPEQNQELMQMMRNHSGFDVDEYDYNNFRYNLLSKDKLLYRIDSLKNMMRSFQISHKIVLSNTDENRYYRILADMEDTPPVEKQTNNVLRGIDRLLPLDVNPIDDKLYLPESCDDMSYVELESWIHGKFLYYDGKNHDEIGYREYVILMRYLATSKRAEESKRQWHEVLVRVHGNDDLSAEVESAHAAYQEFRIKQQHIRKLFNGISNRRDPLHPNTPLQEQLLWIGRFECDVDSSNDDIGAGDVRQQLEECLDKQAIDEETLRKLDSATTTLEDCDKILRDKGIAVSGKKETAFWKTLEAAITHDTGKMINQLEKINEYLRNQNIPFEIFSQQLRSGKKRTYWLVRKISQKNTSQQ